MRPLLSISVAIIVTSTALSQSPPKPNQGEVPPIPAERRTELIESLKQAAKTRGDQTELKRSIKEYEVKIETAKKGTVDPRAAGIVAAANGSKITFPSAAAKEKHLKGLQDQIAKWKDALDKPITDPTYLVPALPVEMKVGAFGRFGTKEVRVEKVVDDTTAIITTWRLVPVARAVNNVPVVQSETVATTVCVSGIDTAKMADESITELPNAFYTAGNRKVGGRTYFNLVAVKFTPEEIDAITSASGGGNKVGSVNEKSGVPQIGEKVRILRAEWGAGDRKADVTERVANLIGQGKAVLVDGPMLGPDPAPNVSKILRVKVQIGDQILQFSIPDRGEFQIGPSK